MIKLYFVTTIFFVKSQNSKTASTGSSTTPIKYFAFPCSDVLAVASELQDAKRKIEDLNIQNDKFSKQVEYLKSKQV